MCVFVYSCAVASPHAYVSGKYPPALLRWERHSPRCGQVDVRQLQNCCMLCSLRTSRHTNSSHPISRRPTANLSSTAMPVCRCPHGDLHPGPHHYTAEAMYQPTSTTGHPAMHDYTAPPPAHPDRRDEEYQNDRTGRPQLAECLLALRTCRPITDLKLEAWSWR